METAQIKQSHQTKLVVVLPLLFSTSNLLNVYVLIFKPS